MHINGLKFAVVIISKINVMPYPEMLVAPMRAELTNQGFTELKSADEVSAAMNSNNDTALVVVNSVCGCAAGSCRPGVLKSLQGDKKPDKDAPLHRCGLGLTGRNPVWSAGWGKP